MRERVKGKHDSDTQSDETDEDTSKLRKTKTQHIKGKHDSDTQSDEDTRKFRKTKTR